jgi:hypothetical protein
MVLILKKTKKLHKKEQKRGQTAKDGNKAQRCKRKRPRAHKSFKNIQ